MTDVTAKALAQLIGIGPRTKTFTAYDAEGFRWDGCTVEHVLVGLSQAGDMALILAAGGLLKALTTGRMDPATANRFRETYTPYQVCQLVACAIRESPINRGVAYVAETWVNANRDRIRTKNFSAAT